MAPGAIGSLSVSERRRVESGGMSGGERACHVNSEVAEVRKGGGSVDPGFPEDELGEVDGSAVPERGVVCVMSLRGLGQVGGAVGFFIVGGVVAFGA